MKRYGLVLPLVFAVVLSCFTISRYAYAQEENGPCKGKNAERYVAGGKECLVFKAFGVDSAGDSPVLLVFLHGDGSLGGAVDYLYGTAERQARRPGVIAIAILRPSFYDSEGNKSTDGENSREYDNYTSRNIESVSLAIGKLKERYRTRRVVLIGHSGGAAYAGVILGKYPDLADSAILVACPCDVGAWRTEIGRRTWSWSLSPHSFVGGISQTARVIAISGELDNVVSPSLQKRYVKSLVERGVTAEYREIPRANHRSGLFSSSVFSSAVESLLGDKIQRILEDRGLSVPLATERSPPLGAETWPQNASLLLPRTAASGRFATIE